MQSMNLESVLKLLNRLMTVRLELYSGRMSLNSMDANFRSCQIK